jgi:hypothetical protein
VELGQAKTVTWVYSRGQATVSIEYVDVQTGADVAAAQTLTVPAGPYGPYDPVSVPYYAYEGLAYGSSPASGVVAIGGSVNITFLYRLGQATVIVQHKDAATGDDVATTQSNTVPSGAYGPYNPLSIPFYRAGQLAPYSDSASGTVSPGGTVTITYLYTRGQSEVVVRHLDAASGAVLLPSVGHQVPSGPYGPYGPEAIPFYLPGVLAPGSDAAGGTIEDGQSRTVTYLYTRGQATVTIEYVDVLTGVALETPDVLTVSAGAYGPYLPKDINYFHPGQLHRDSAPAFGTVGIGENVIIRYEYEQMTATINIVHRNYYTGWELLSETLTVPAGAYGPYQPLAFEGYSYGTWYAYSDPAEGFIDGDATITIIFIYRPYAS